ncbi:HD domain-containing protein [Desulfosporosinus sp. Sb-LF]|uniref:HD domain-containing protein n=1 Tax=Desulfosporosinus sp. Sb-LF TaxID=2560027 RepID=UPI00107F94FC|nr:HD domain-containing protein [Desulfosporosinus sp. Sb-LF]TGE32292.1 HD domain-containing protein [Desulfosporosinus sp. Sb-LF]
MKWNFINNLQRIYDLLDNLKGQTMERDYPITWEKVHATSCAQIGRLLAEQRSIDKEQAALACALHDMGRWVSGKQLDHAPKGEELVRYFLTEGKVYDEKIREQIVNAVINHSKKDQVGTPLEELVKDADIIDCHFHGDEMTKPFHVARLKNTLKELGIDSSNEKV